MDKVTTIAQYNTTSTPGKFEKVKLNVPELKPHDILIEVAICGVCQTDCMYMVSEGLNLGHEICGIIVEKGSEVNNLEIGETVGSSYLKWSCLDCRHCKSGEDKLCGKSVLFPEGNINGFASHMVADSRFACKIPKGIEPKQAAVMMCAGITVFSAMYNNKITAASRVAVVGIGGLGHLALQFARAWGCHVTAISHSPDKKEEALKLGAHDFLVDKDIDPDALKYNKKFDYIFNTVPISIDYNKFFKTLRRGGKFVMVGIPLEKITIEDPFYFIRNELGINGSPIGNRVTIDIMLEFIALHNIKAQLQEYPLDIKGLEKAIDVCSKGKARYRAVLVKQSVRL